MLIFMRSIVIFTLFIGITKAIRTQVRFEFDFKCGNQPVTGELSVEKGRFNTLFQF
jgi:hypothetical protein